jgi:multisubunit Na+/H+ antiporter MnhF subunit
MILLTYVPRNFGFGLFISFLIYFIPITLSIFFLLKKANLLSNTNKYKLIAVKFFYIIICTTLTVSSIFYSGNFFRDLAYAIANTINTIFSLN